MRDELELHVKGCHPPYCDPSHVARRGRRGPRTLLGVDGSTRSRCTVTTPRSRSRPFAEALLAQVERRHDRGFGVSNWTFARFEELQSALGVDAARLAALLEPLLARRDGRADLAGDARDVAGRARRRSTRAGVTALAWAALAGGLLRGTRAAELGRRRQPRAPQRADELARRLGVTTPAVALAYVLSQGPRVWAAVGTRSLAHLDELLRAPALELSADDLLWLRDG